MTLNDLIIKATALSYQFSSGEIPLVFPRERLTLDQIEDIDLKYNEKEGYIEVRLKSTPIVLKSF